MNKLGKLDPIQYYRGGAWIDVVVPLLKTSPRIQAILSKMGACYLECMESILEPDLSPEDLADELGLLDHEFRVRSKSFHYLRSHFDSFDLAKLSLALADEIFPAKTWTIVEAGEEAIVIDVERSMVFDFKHCYELTGLGVLALCGDPVANKDPKAAEEVGGFHKQRIEDLRANNVRMKRDLERHSNQGHLLNFPGK